MGTEKDFLAALAQAISTMSLYEEEHPAREGAVERAYEALLPLLEGGQACRFTFLDDEVIAGDRPLRELRRWDWTRRFERAGLQRMEFAATVDPEDFGAFVDFAYRRLAGEPLSTASAQTERSTGVRYGMLGVRGGEDEEGTETEETDEPGEPPPSFDLNDEFDAIDWLHQELQDGRELHLLEAESLVRSLSVAMHGHKNFLIPLLRLKQSDQYTTAHALNVSVLAMALAEFVGLSPSEVQAFGVSGLLHDLGKVTIPSDVLNKPGKLTPSERELINSHTVAGARLILEAEENLDMAAVVAYEHHVRIDGGGYPAFQYPRRCHRASELIHVCDVFDALRTHRPYRDAWSQERVLSYIEEGGGGEFEADLATAFVRMFGQWSDRVAAMEDPKEALPI